MYNCDDSSVAVWCQFGIVAGAAACEIIAARNIIDHLSVRRQTSMHLSQALINMTNHDLQQRQILHTEIWHN